jgi:hypothetical protein
MNESEHTNGPWFAYHQNEHHEWQIGAGVPPEDADNDGHYEFIVAQTFGGIGSDDSESDANARLIAAAPDLLAVHLDSVEILEIVLEEREEIVGEDEVLRNLISRIKEVVAKAEGQS